MASTLSLTRREAVVGAAAATLGSTLPSSLRAQTVRVRMDIATFAQDVARLAKFEDAVRTMQSHSESDPKGWLRNAHAHARYCSVAETDPDQVHFCYFFLAWHRAYIWVTERKIREISGDESFSYPYWNWSTDRHIPAAFARSGSPLANANRDTPPRGLRDSEVGFRRDDPRLRVLGVAALSARRFLATTAAQIPFSFGGIARPNSDNAYDNAFPEGTPHGPVHVYVGGDMSDFETAARDPIFFAHHGNLDRLWENWRRDPAHKASEPTSTAFLDHKFPFIWLDGSTIHVAVRDVLDTHNLGYTYDYLDAIRPDETPAVASAQAASETLPSIGQSKLKLPFRAEGVEDENERKILQITDVEAPETVMTVGVYLRTPQTPPEELGTNVGSFSALRAGGKIAWPSKTLSFDITAAAKKFAGQEIVVDLIPYKIRAEGVEESYPKLKYGGMAIVTEK